MSKKKYPKQTVYYDSFNDDFEFPAGSSAAHEKVTYPKRGMFFRLFSFFAHNVIALPIAYFYSRVILRDKIIGKERLRGHKSFILYSNHTEPVGDALAPHTFVFPRRAYTVVSPANLKLPVIGRLIPYLGAIPTPNDLRSAREFSQCLGTGLAEGGAVIVFPEAHVWKKYTGIRPMDAAAFDLPRKYSTPAFVATRVYRRAKFFGYRCHIYIDGPFYSDSELSLKDACEKLKGEITDTMISRAELSDVEIIKYIKNGE